jgi:hypothetical protein
MLKVTGSLFGRTLQFLLSSFIYWLDGLMGEEVRKEGLVENSW